MRYDLYKWDGTDALQLWRNAVELSELFRAFGFVRVKDKLRDLRHLEGIFLTPELFLIPTGKTPKLLPALLPASVFDSPPSKHPANGKAGATNDQAPAGVTR